MRIYHGMSTSEFVAQLREIAIGANAGPIFIDQLDAIEDAKEQEAELERVGNELAEMSDDRDLHKEALGDLLEACEAEQDPSIKLFVAIKQAKLILL